VVDAPDLSTFVPQRGGTRDCTLAALATVTGRTYEEVAEALGVQIDLTTGLPDIGPGIDPLATIYPLLRLGWLCAPLVAREKLDKDGYATIEEIKAILPGRKAVLGYVDSDP
jgi:hypothetical protein